MPEMLSSKFETHPYGVRPSGNYWLSRGNESSSITVLHRTTTCGLFAKLSDTQTLEILEYLKVEDLIYLSNVNKVFYAYANHDPLWKDLLVGLLCAKNPKYSSLSFQFPGTWRMATEMVFRKPGSKISRPHPYGEIYSDVLHRPWQCATAPVLEEWLHVDNVARRDSSLLSVEQFVNDFEIPNRPVVITNAASDWPALKEWPSLFGISTNQRTVAVGEENLDVSSQESKEQNTNASENKAEGIDQCSGTAKQQEAGSTHRHEAGLGECVCRVGPMDLKLKHYIQYAKLHHDENPLYLFDCKFCERMPLLEKGYSVPSYFANSPQGQWNERDLFELLGSKGRPDYRWLITGQACSGSKWHVDPNCTNAWNALVVGRKKWIMFPPSTVPPGVQPSKDGADVIQPISLMEWFLNFYDEIHQLPPEQQPIEFISEAGDIVFVPCGWWHCVLNLDNTIAVTQNYISSSNMSAGLRFYRDHKHLISGYCNSQDKTTLFDRLSTVLKTQRPELWEKFIDEEQKRKEAEELRKRKRETHRSWSEVTKKVPGSETFSFGFSFD